MGAAIVSRTIYEAFMKGPDGIEIFHGYTYSGHPTACAAGLASLDIYARENLLTRAKTGRQGMGRSLAFVARSAVCHRCAQLRA